MPKSKVPDYNPDKDRHVRHKYIVQPAWPSGAKKDGVNLPDGRFAKYGREKRFTLNDEGLARELQERERNSLVVTRVRYPDKADHGHNYVHTVSISFDKDGNIIR